MAFKGLKKTATTVVNNHFDTVGSDEKKEVIIGRPFADPYKKQDKRVQFYISQEMIDTLAETARANGCKDITAYAKVLLVEAFEKLSKKD
jgi:hypothetical protein